MKTTVTQTLKEYEKQFLINGKETLVRVSADSSYPSSSYRGSTVVKIESYV